MSSSLPQLPTKALFLKKMNVPLLPPGYTQVLEEHTSGTAPSLSYIVGLSALAQTSATGSTSYFMVDGQGSTRQLTDSTGTISARFAFDAYGNLLYVPVGVLNPPATEILYTGQLFIVATVQYYLRARTYMPMTARFTTMDSNAGHTVQPLSLHKYIYTMDNPINAVDLSGHETLGEVMVSEEIAENQEAMEDEAAVEVEKRAVKSKMYDFDIGIGWDITLSFGLLPHMFIYVPNKIAGIGQKYDAVQDGLYVRSFTVEEVKRRNWLIKIGEFSFPQYIEWRSTAWILSAMTKQQRLMIETRQALKYIDFDLTFSLTFLPGTINCFKWTLYAGFEGWRISKFGA
jgi:RHS repeat-associated protein